MGVLRIRGDQTVAWPHLPFPERVGRVAPEHRSEEAVGKLAVSGSAANHSEEAGREIRTPPSRPERASSDTTSGAGPSSARSVDAAPEESFLRRAEGPDEESL